MDIGATLFATGWASGVNAYATVALLGILGRSGAADVPEPLTGNLVIAIAVVMFAIEFVADKVAYVDSAWDSVHTLIRPAIGAWLGALFAGHDGGDVSQVLAAAGSGATALASHGVKAGLRILINTMPEPFSNIAVSLTEDGLVATVVAIVVNNPVLAFAIAATLLLAGIAVLIVLYRRLIAAIRRMREKGRGPSGR
jgi:Domain of unknown function (DUF4126)